jgi:outer membrane protein TolC
VLNLEVKLAEAQEERIRTRNGYRLAIAALNAALGYETVADTDTLVATPVSDTAVPALEEDARLNRPELLAAQEMVSAKQAGLRKARREAGSPVVSAFGSADWDSDVSSDFENSYLVGVVAEKDLFTGFQRRRSTAVARAELAVAQAELEKLENDLQLDLKSAVIRVQEARQRIEVTGQSLAGAAEALRITRERYEQGAADITELLAAQTGHTATQTRDAAARYDFLTAVANLERAGGKSITEN